MTRRIFARPLAILATVAVAIAACGGPAGTPAVGTGAPATVVPGTQALATQAPASIGPGFSIQLPSEDKDLEAILPSEIAGETVTKVSMSGDSFLGAGQGTDEMEATLLALGKAPSDLSVAFAGSASVVLIAFRVKGVDANTIYGAVIQASEDEDVANITDVTIAGKAAKKVVDSTATSTYLYLTGDAVVTITGVGPALTDAVLNEIFSKLP